MTETAIVHTDISDSRAAGSSLGEQISAEMQARPDALIVFASAQHDYASLLESIDSACRPARMVGCSSAGEFTSEVPHEHSACAVALRSAEMRFSSGLGRGLAADRASAARDIVASFQGLSGHDYVHRTVLVLTDALAGHAEELVDELTLLTGGTYQLVGGGAGDDARFDRTHVFSGVEAVSNAAVGLEILSNKPLGVGVCHAWEPTSPGMRVTASDGMRLVSLNAFPAVQAFEEHASATGQAFDMADPLPFFLHNVLGINTGVGYKLRVPLSVEEDGSVLCAAEVPVGSTVHIMSAGESAPSEAAKRAVESAIEAMDGSAPGIALFFDCVATRLRMGREFGPELEAVQQALGPGRFAGCNTYGQIARAEGQFSGFHNCTAVVCIFPA